MFELCVKAEFPAAHHLEGYPGDCARVHGHNFGVEIAVSGEELDNLGLSVDFRTLKKSIQEVISAWDHQDLNQLPDFNGINPTAERIAQVLYSKLRPVVESRGVTGRKLTLERVTIAENCQYKATYWEEK